LSDNCRSQYVDVLRVFKTNKHSQLQRWRPQISDLMAKLLELGRVLRKEEELIPDEYSSQPICHGVAIEAHIYRAILLLIHCFVLILWEVGSFLGLV
jgi:hypothetical protein